MDKSLESQKERRKRLRSLSAERKELSTHMPISCENVFRNEGKIKTFSDEGKLRKLLSADLP